MDLERDLEAFRLALPELLKAASHRGKYALIHAARVDSIWPTFDDALAAGYDRFGTDPFLVQEITDDERPKYFSRNVAPCRS
ncbi:MAG TPA: hypothetical protein VKA46_29925 [Gemmataceae bacterium]|nr:hypothetical protein [Gemmataceae bacterium]